MYKQRIINTICRGHMISHALHQIIVGKRVFNNFRRIEFAIAAAAWKSLFSFMLCSTIVLVMAATLATASLLGMIGITIIVGVLVWIGAGSDMPPKPFLPSYLLDYTRPQPIIILSKGNHGGSSSIIGCNTTHPSSYQQRFYNLPPICRPYNKRHEHEYTQAQWIGGIA